MGEVGSAGGVVVTSQEPVGFERHDMSDGHGDNDTAAVGDAGLGFMLIATAAQAQARLTI